jgi:hypothetical protein
MVAHYIYKVIFNSNTALKRGGLVGLVSSFEQGFSHFEKIAEKREKRIEYHHFYLPVGQGQCHKTFLCLFYMFKYLFTSLHLQASVQWKRINCKQSTRWQHLSRLKASAFLFKNFFLGVEKYNYLYLRLVTPSSG